MKYPGNNLPWLWSGLLLLVGAGGACLLSSRAVPPQEPVLAATTARPQAPAVDRMTGLASPEADRGGPRFPAEFFRRYPPGSRIPMSIPYVGAGIPVGPGLFLPPLNGVKVEDGIPAIGRNPRLPPPGPVVAKVVAADGQEYWEHEDGSYTSCTYSRIRTPDGTLKEIVATQHGAIAGKDSGRGRAGASSRQR